MNRHLTDGGRRGGGEGCFFGRQDEPTPAAYAADEIASRFQYSFPRLIRGFEGVGRVNYSDRPW